MSNSILVQYVGFQAKPLVREYTFSVREAGDQREFTVTIANEAFDSHRLRYQDAPSICSSKLRRELASHDNRPPKNHFRITDAELQDYQDAHRPASSRSLFASKAERELNPGKRES